MRKKIVPLVERSRALEDLIDSFPALLFALATDFGSRAARERTIAAIDSGAPLRYATTLLGLPWWTRRLPAAALDSSLSGLPGDTDAGQRLIAFVPSDPVLARCWLRAVGYCCRACSEEFGIWVASWIGRTPGLLLPIVSDNARLLAAWGWASTHPGTPSAALLRRPWTPAMGPRRALEEVAAWRQRIELHLHLAVRPPNSELLPATVQGYEFRPLLTAADFISESLAMDNCLDQYGDRLAERGSRIFSIRRDGRAVADVEIGVHDEEPTMPAIRQLRGPRNRRTSGGVWRAAYAWLGSQPIRALAHRKASMRKPAAARRGAANEFWRSYLDDRAADLTTQELKDLSSAIDGGGLVSTKAHLRRRQASTRRAIQDR